MTDFSAVGFEGSPQMQVAKLRAIQGRGNVLNMQAQEAQMKLEQARKMQALMQGVGKQVGANPAALPGIGGQPDDAAKMQETFGLMSAEAGDYRGASKFLSDAATTRSRNATERTQMALRGAAQEKARWERLVKVEQLTNSVVDDDSLAAANAEYTRVFREQSPFAGRSYAEVKPQLDTLSQQILTVKERASLSRTDRDFARKQENDKSAAAHNAVMEGIAERKATSQIERNKRLAKTGGAKVNAPTKNEVDMVFPLVKNAMPDLEPAELLVKANAVASMAKKKMRDQQGGLHFEEAARKAIREINKTPGVTYQDGKTPANAYPWMPDEKFEVGKYYETSKGIGKFVGKGFELLPTEVNLDELYPTEGE